MGEHPCVCVGDSLHSRQPSSGFSGAADAGTGDQADAMVIGKTRPAAAPVPVLEKHGSAGAENLLAPSLFLIVHGHPTSRLALPRTTRAPAVTARRRLPLL